MMDDMRTDDEHSEHVDPPAALRALDDVVAPDRLRLAVAEQVAEAQRRAARARRLPELPRLRLRGALAAAGAAAAVLIVALVLALGGGGNGGGGSAPGVRDVAAVALRPALAAAPAARPGGELLAAHAGPIAFPTWRRAGWHAIGARSDRLDGATVRTVLYADGAGRRIGYAIADGALPVSGGQLVTRQGTPLRVLDRGATSVVTWRRDGRTCVLAGHGVPVQRLLTLASYEA